MEQLCALYEEKSEIELEQLYAGREDLTEVAQQALAQVMRERGISIQPAAAPVIEGIEPLEVDPATLLAENEVYVARFDDAFEAKEALRRLTGGGVNPRVINVLQFQESALRRRGPTVDLRVAVGCEEEKSARAILADRLATFPEREGDDPLAELSGLQLVGMFERADALLAAQALGEGGMSYVWDDGHDNQYETSESISIQVKAERLDEAQKLVEERFALLDEGPEATS
jgi:hypothetical protein